MTKDEFYYDVTDFESLVDFCNYHSDFYHIVENIKSSDDFDDWVWDTLEQCRPHSYWYEARDWLSDLEAPRADYYEETGRLEYNNLWEDDLDRFVNEVIEYGEEIGFWEDDGDDNDEDNDEDEDSDDECWNVSVDLSVLIGF